MRKVAVFFIKREELDLVKNIEISKNFLCFERFCFILEKRTGKVRNYLEEITNKNEFFQLFTLISFRGRIMGP